MPAIKCLTKYMDPHEKVVAMDGIPTTCQDCLKKWVVLTDAGRAFIVRYEGLNVFTVERSEWAVRAPIQEMSRTERLSLPSGVDISV